MNAETFPEAMPATSARFLNRELSWLEFNARVLALAEDPARPLLERVKFLAIYTQNLDEFFQIRVSGLEEQVEAGVAAVTPDGMTPPEQLEAIRERIDGLQARAEEVLSTDLTPALEKERIRLVHWEQLSEDDRGFLGRRFSERIFPVLTPLSVDPAHPFPYISSLSLNVAAAVRDPMTGVRKFARVKVPPILPRFIELPDGERFVPLEEVIAAHMDELFPGMDLLSHHFFRVTRDADVEVEEDEADDLLAAIETVLQRRQRGATPIRLEIDDTMSGEVREVLMRELSLDESQVYVVDGLLALSDLWFFVNLDRADLKDEPWTPVTPPELQSQEGLPDVFEAVGRGDILVHHPYDSYESSVAAFVDQAARDPDVLAIKQTLYRTSADSPIIRSLVRAADAGKQVVALVELKARFDEEANISFARTLETAGVHVVYGMVGLKTHAKTCLVVRRENDGHPAVRAPGDGQLQLHDRAPVRRHRAVDGRPRSRCGSHGPVQPAHRLQPAARIPQAAGGPGHPAPRPRGPGPPGDGAGRRLHRAEDEQPRGQRPDRCALRSVAVRGPRRAADPRHLLSASRASRACPRASGSAPSSDGSWSIPGSTGSGARRAGSTT